MWLGRWRKGSLLRLRLLRRLRRLLWLLLQSSSLQFDRAEGGSQLLLLLLKLCELCSHLAI